jgi:hypothetical protein
MTAQHLACFAPPRSFFRCLTIHGTNNLWVQNNVGFDVSGHCFYIEVGWHSRAGSSGGLAQS